MLNNIKFFRPNSCIFEKKTLPLQPILMEEQGVLTIYKIPNNMQRSETSEKQSKLIAEIERLLDRVSTDAHALYMGQAQYEEEFERLNKEHEEECEAYSNQIRAYERQIVAIKRTYDKLLADERKKKAAPPVVQPKVKEKKAEEKKVAPELTLDMICKYALKRNEEERKTISLMLLKLIKHPDDATRAKIDALDEPTERDARKIVMGDNVQTKIVRQ